MAVLLTTIGPVAAGEINDSNEAVEKIVIRVNDDPEFDPELSVGGETITAYEGDVVTFRIAINEDQTAVGRDNFANVKDVYKRNRFQFVSAVGEFTGTTCTNPNETDPADTSVSCVVALDPVDGNAALRISLRVLDIGGETSDPRGCVIATNVVSTVEPSGGDQAQITLCPAALRPTPAPTPTPAPAGGQLPNTAAIGSGPGTATLVVVLATLGALIAAVSLPVLVRSRRR